MKTKTTLCNLLGIEYPIIQGGMAWVSEHVLAAAVSNAGGLGLISAMSSDAEWVRSEIRLARKLTDKPFGVNIMLMSPHAAAVAAVVAEENVAVVTTGAGNPSKYIKMWKDAGIKVLPVIPSVGLARLMERAGADAVIAEGGESGGHIGDLSTMALTPQVVDAVRIPVIAAGGIADGRGLAAAICLGACGVQIGTRFVASTECQAHDNYKKMIIDAKDIDSMVSGRRLGHPVRSLKNEFSRKFAEYEYDNSITNAEIEAYGAGALRRASVEGDLVGGCYMAGQISGLIRDVKPVQDIITDIISQAESILCGHAVFSKCEDSTSQNSSSTQPLTRIASFDIDHTQLKRGLYLSRVDGDIFTYDLRMCEPYSSNLLSNIEMHSLEHMLATALRNSAAARDIIYVGAMGCQTGFYVLIRGQELAAAKAIIINGLTRVLEMTEMPGGSRIECGNCNSLDLASGKDVAAKYLEVI